MTRLPRIVAGAIALSLTAAHDTSAQPPTRDAMVDVGGYRLHTRIAGTRRTGVPAVVFVSGLGSPLGVWEAVQTSIATATVSVAYDRAGIGASDPAKEPRTIMSLVGELHRLLERLAVADRYVLVGHSYGGPIIHAFAATYPNDVAALVFVDPTDFMQTDADMDAAWALAGAPRGRESIRSIGDRMMAAMPDGVRAEWQELDRAERGGFAPFRAAGDPPALPTAVLLAGRNHPPSLPVGTTLPAEYDNYTKVAARQRFGHFAEMVGRLPSGRLVLTSSSGHFIQSSEPALVEWAVLHVLAAHAAAAAQPALDRFIGQYRLTPDLLLSITRDGDTLSAQATGQPALRLKTDSATRFSFAAAGVEIDFQLDANGTCTGLVLSQGGVKVNAVKIR